jgi:hypothetical protein
MPHASREEKAWRADWQGLSEKEREGEREREREHLIA